MVQWVVDQAPGAAVFGLALLVGVGLLLWLFGSRLAKPAAVVSGVVMGASVTASLAGLWAGLNTLTIAFIALGGAILGGVLSGVLFRLWMGLSGALVLAAVVPAGVLVWQGTPGLEIPGTTLEPGEAEASVEADRAQTEAVVSSLDGRDGEGDDAVSPEATAGGGNAWLDFLSRNMDQATQATQPGSGVEGEGGGLDPEQLTTELGGDLGGDLGGEQAREAIQQVSDQMKAAAKTVWLKNAEAMKGWWEQVTPETQKVVYTGALAGGVIGLLLGLLLPTGSAMLQSSVVGALMLLLPGRELIALKLPEYAGFLPGTPRQLVIALGLITALGIGLQWMLRRRRAEK
ncbi:MAG: hypothetical protein AAGI68_08720 [Planctomycetota bacterium]